MRKNRTETIRLINAGTATGNSDAVDANAVNLTIQAVGSTTNGAGAATVFVQVTNDGTNYIDAGTITLTLATSASSDGFALDAPWDKVRARINAISGTGASVSVYMCRGIKA